MGFIHLVNIDEITEYQLCVQQWLGSVGNRKEEDKISPL